MPTNPRPDWVPVNFPCYWLNIEGLFGDTSEHSCVYLCSFVFRSRSAHISADSGPCDGSKPAVEVLVKGAGCVDFPGLFGD